jgi:hypothetical protein
LVRVVVGLPGTVSVERLRRMLASWLAVLRLLVVLNHWVVISRSHCKDTVDAGVMIGLYCDFSSFCSGGSDFR